MDVVFDGKVRTVAFSYSTYCQRVRSKYGGGEMAAQHQHQRSAVGQGPTSPGKREKDGAPGARQGALAGWRK